MSYEKRTTHHEGIEHVTFVPSERKHETPLLFVHGMWHGAWCWEEWQAQLAALGWESHAISLPGHAGSPVQRPLRFCTLDYYLNFVGKTVEAIGRKPVLLGHSMGGALTQRYLKYVGDDLPAAVLVASWPYQFGLSAFPMLIRLEPVGTIVGMLTLDARWMVRTPQAAAKLLLGPDASVTPEWLHQRLGGESYIAMSQWMLWRAPQKLNTPMLVLAGEHDAVCPLPRERATAEHYGADLHVVTGAGHNLMHEKSSPETVSRIDSWLSARVG